MIGICVTLGCNNREPSTPIEFKQEAWLLGDRSVRGKMVSDIINDSLLIGKSKSEVLSLLGDQGDTSGNFSYAVDIGLKTGPFGLGGVWLFDLNIHFDTLSRKVIHVQCND